MTIGAWAARRAEIGTSRITEVAVRKLDEDPSRSPASPGSRRAAAPSAATPLPRAPGRLESAVAALDQLAQAAPGEPAVLAAVCDRNGERSDLLLRDERGHVVLVAGLSGPDRSRLAALLELARGSASGASGEDRPAEPASLHRLLTEGSPVSLLLADSEGVIHLATPLASEQLGFERSSALRGRRLSDLVHDQDRDALARVWSGLGGAERLEAAITLRVRRRDAGSVRLELALRSLAEQGEPGWVAIALAEPQRSREALMDELAGQRRLRALADSADCGTALFTLHDGQVGVLLDANLALGRIAGVPSEQLIGCAPEALVDAADAPRLREALGALVRTGQPQRLQARLARRTLALVELHARLDRSSGDPPTQVALRVRDLTDQRASNADLRAEVERLERANRELAELARVCAHELGAPLRALAGLADLLASPGASADGTLDAVRSAIARMQGMVEGLLGYAQSGDAEELRREPVELERVLEYALDSLETQIQASNAMITATELPTVDGDPHQLERLLRNLIDNAIKYAGEERPRIAVQAVAEGSRWLLSVADQGIGVCEQERDRVFELFARDSEAGVAGRGIGLAVCRRIVELHGGRIWVDSNEPRGTIVQFTLPAAATQAAAPGSAQLTAAAEAGAMPAPASGLLTAASAPRLRLASED
jgi:PAS domain S-box-containing protein